MAMLNFAMTVFFVIGDIILITLVYLLIKDTFNEWNDEQEE